MRRRGRLNMKLFYDFHIHSCLSPCGDEDSTPNNIVNMALLKGLNAIALSDHNTGKNCPAAMAVGKKKRACRSPRDGTDHLRRHPYSLFVRKV